MPTIFSKNAQTGETVREDISEEEAVTRGIRESLQQRNARKAKVADRETNKNRVLASAFVDLLIALRDGELEGLTKPQVMALLRQHVAASLD
jgi:hypothetical protein